MFVLRLRLSFLKAKAFLFWDSFLFESFRCPDVDSSFEFLVYVGMLQSLCTLLTLTTTFSITFVVGKLGKIEGVGFRDPVWTKKAKAAMGWIQIQSENWTNASIDSIEIQSEQNTTKASIKSSEIQSGQTAKLPFLYQLGLEVSRAGYASSESGPGPIESETHRCIVFQSFLCRSFRND